MVATAEEKEDAKALEQLKSRASRGQFCRGAREPWVHRGVHRELRRTDLATTGSFDNERQEALLLFGASDPERVTVREVAPDPSAASAEVRSLDANYGEGLLKELAETRKELSTLKGLTREVPELQKMQVQELHGKEENTTQRDSMFLLQPVQTSLFRVPRTLINPGKLEFSTVVGTTVENCTTGVECRDEQTQTSGQTLAVEQLKEDEMDLLSPSSSDVLHIAGVELG